MTLFSRFFGGDRDKISAPDADSKKDFPPVTVAIDLIAEYSRAIAKAEAAGDVDKAGKMRDILKRIQSESQSKPRSAVEAKTAAVPRTPGAETPVDEFGEATVEFDIDPCKNWGVMIEKLNNTPAVDGAEFDRQLRSAKGIVSEIEGELGRLEKRIDRSMLGESKKDLQRSAASIERIKKYQQKLISACDMLANKLDNYSLFLRNSLKEIEKREGEGHLDTGKEELQSAINANDAELEKLEARLADLRQQTL